MHIDNNFSNAQHLTAASLFLEYNYYHITKSRGIYIRYHQFVLH